ncbi:hypothetical protein ACIQFP_01005 [Nocardiopsis alba]
MIRIAAVRTRPAAPTARPARTRSVTPSAMGNSRPVTRPTAA